MSQLPKSNLESNAYMETETAITKDEDTLQMISNIFKKYSSQPNDKRTKIPQIIKDYVRELVASEKRQGMKTLDKIKKSIEEMYDVPIGRSTIHLLIKKYREEGKKKRRRRTLKQTRIALHEFLEDNIEDDDMNIILDQNNKEANIRTK